MLGWMSNGPQQLTGVTQTCNTTTVGRVFTILYLSESFVSYT